MGELIHGPRDGEFVDVGRHVAVVEVPLVVHQPSESYEMQPAPRMGVYARKDRYPYFYWEGEK